jgi:hypothetical protein
MTTSNILSLQRAYPVMLIQTVYTEHIVMYYKSDYRLTDHLYAPLGTTCNYSVIAFLHS